MRFLFSPQPQPRLVRLKETRNKNKFLEHGGKFTGQTNYGKPSSCDLVFFFLQTRGQSNRRIPRCVDTGQAGSPETRRRPVDDLIYCWPLVMAAGRAWTQQVRCCAAAAAVQARAGDSSSRPSPVCSPNTC